MIKRDYVRLSQTSKFHPQASFVSTMFPENSNVLPWEFIYAKFRNLTIHDF